MVGKAGERDFEDGARSGAHAERLDGQMQIVVAPGFAGAHGWIDAGVVAEAQVHKSFHARAGDLPDRGAVADGSAAEVVMERARGQLDVGGRTRVVHVMRMGVDCKLDGYLRAEAPVGCAVLREE